MELIGAWSSGYTRRVGITLNLLEIPFEHIDIDVFKRPEDIRPFSPMLRVPILRLSTGEVLLDSHGIIDYLHETVGQLRALIAIGGLERRQALKIVGTATAVYEKFRSVEHECSRPSNIQSKGIMAFYAAQALTGLEMLESHASGGWLVGGALSQADIMTVVAYQAIINSPFFPEVTAGRFPKLSVLCEHAMLLPAFASTAP